ncbi:carbohydrate esterase family 8 protein [Mycena galericulata]|nr:carbohydrate esterase family 8 protein [Mycena galericulata]
MCPLGCRRGPLSRFIECQIQKPAWQSPSTGCPPGTIFVSQNVSDRHAKFTTDQAAIASLPENGPATILSAKGSYEEVVNVSRIAPLTLLGQLPSTARAEAKPFANPSSLNPNSVQIWNTQFVMTGEDDASSAVLTVAPNLADSHIGAGTDGASLQPDFANIDFKAYNIDFQNRAANFAISQALVTVISYANASFYVCTFASYQDTFTYVVDSVIFGQTDFGSQNVILKLARRKGSNQTFAPGNRYGAYISSSTIMRSPDANATTLTTGLCFLGRPWNDLATTVYLNNFMDASIQPVGFEPFHCARYAEFNSTGPGGDTSERVAIEHILEANIDGVFLQRPQWIDFEYLF